MFLGAFRKDYANAQIHGGITSPELPKCYQVSQYELQLVERRELFITIPLTIGAIIDRLIEAGPGQVNASLKDKLS